MTATAPTPQFATINEVDEGRPHDGDGNYLLHLLTRGELTLARRESDRLTAYYAQEGISVARVNQWRAWCAGVERYLSSPQPTPPTETQ